MAMDIHYDALAAIMALMVTFVASIIHLYSVSFMREDTDYVRYFCYLNLFVFFMLVIALANNLIFVYLGWEGVGFCSYALIGFWYGDPVKATAGKKAFIMTRLGDIGFGIAVACFSFTSGLFPSPVSTRRQLLSAPEPPPCSPCCFSARPWENRLSCRSQPGCRTPWPGLRPFPP